jgi:hypothetical protein
MPATRQQQSHFRALGLRRACALSALLGLALLQLSLASHQFQHQGNDLLEVCGICMQLDRMDDSLAPAGPVLLAATTASPWAVEWLQRAPSAPANYYQSRAPPAV